MKPATLALALLLKNKATAARAEEAAREVAEIHSRTWLEQNRESLRGKDAKPPPPLAPTQLQVDNAARGLVQGVLGEVRAFIAQAEARIAALRAPDPLAPTQGQVSKALESVRRAYRDELASLRDKAALESAQSRAEAAQTRAEALAELEKAIAALKPVAGPVGPMPKHEWKGTKLRFQVTESEWGEYVDLKGEPGRSIAARGGSFPDASSVVVPTKIITVTSDTTLAQEPTVVLVDASAGPVTITLPAINALSRPDYIIKKMDASENAVTVEAIGTTVELSASVEITRQRTSPHFYSTGAVDYGYIIA